MEDKYSQAKSEGYWVAEWVYLTKIEDLEWELMFNPALKEDEKEFYFKGLIKNF